MDLSRLAEAVLQNSTRAQREEQEVRLLAARKIAYATGWDRLHYLVTEAAGTADPKTQHALFDHACQMAERWAASEVGIHSTEEKARAVGYAAAAREFIAQVAVRV